MAAPYPPFSTPRRRTESLAVASLACAVAAYLVCPLTAPVGMALGVMAKRRIRASGGELEGDGLATAGIIVGGIYSALLLAGLAFGLVLLIGLAG